MLEGNLSKADYLGKSIDCLIPHCYIEEHCAGIRNLREHHSKRLVGVELDTIFVVGANQCIIATSIFHKYSPNIFN